jgi:CO/xanthine dehydrogenase Mo-binding subunit
MTNEVGRSRPVLEARSKVEGSADYVVNHVRPRMLHGAILRSTEPHATMDEIDTTAARSCAGVRSVITGRDVAEVIKDPYYGPAFHDQPILALDKVRYVGEPVALVLADRQHIAAAAAELISVVYRALPPVFDAVTACEDGAPLVHAALRPGTAFADLQHLAGISGSNVALHSRIRHGDLDAGWAASTRVSEHEYETQPVAHAPLESHSAIAEFVASGRLEVESSTQSPSFVRLELARLLGWPEAQVRVMTSYLGGGFGAKLYMKLEALATAAALITHRPVRVAISMDEQFFTISRHATTTRIKTGVDKTGKLLARSVDTYWNGGAYADIGPRVTQKSGFVAAGPYRIDAVQVDSRAVYTNRTPAGAMRGFGVPQMVFAHESHTDEIAATIGMDPIEFRRRNLLTENDEHATGTLLESVATLEVLELLETKMRWSQEFDRGTAPLRRGRGVAMALKAVVTPTTSVATLSLAGDGSLTLHQGTVDMGQGSSTAMAVIVGETLGVSPESVVVLTADTDTTPYDMGTLGSRSTFHMGNAVLAATLDLKQQLIAVAADITGREPGEITLSAGRRGDLSFEDIMSARHGAQAGTLVGYGTYTPEYTKPDLATGQSPDITAFWMAGAAGAEISVDTETGRIRVERLVCVADLGIALNPDAARRQLSGAVIMQLGMTLTEEMRYEGGQLTNPGLGFYKVPTALDVPPDIDIALVERPHPRGPYGAKGVGETGTFAVSPAIANALADATGVRLRCLPLTPERVLRGLHAKSGGTLA